jgi:hypothetical protein
VGNQQRAKENGRAAAMHQGKGRLETAGPRAYSAGVKEHSLTLSVPASVLRWIEKTRGGAGSSEYIVQLLEQRMEQAGHEEAERESWLALGRRQYTEQVCRQTVEINDEFPIHEE